MIFLFIICFPNAILLELTMKNSLTMPSKYAESVRMGSQESRITNPTSLQHWSGPYGQGNKSDRYYNSISPVYQYNHTAAIERDGHPDQYISFNSLWSRQIIEGEQTPRCHNLLQIENIQDKKENEHMPHVRSKAHRTSMSNCQWFEQLQQPLTILNKTCRAQNQQLRTYFTRLRQWLNSNNQSGKTCTWLTDESCTKTKVNKITAWNSSQSKHNQHGKYQVDGNDMNVVVESETNKSLEFNRKLDDLLNFQSTKTDLWDNKNHVDNIQSIQVERLESLGSTIKFDHDNRNLFDGFQNIVPVNLQSIKKMSETFERLLIWHSFTTGQATKILNCFDGLTYAIGQMKEIDASLKSITNKLLQFLDLFTTRIVIGNQRNVSFKYDHIHIFVSNFNMNNESHEWLQINSNKYQENMNRNIIIEINVRVLKRLSISSNDYRITEIIFSNFYLFPHLGVTHFGLPISYQIGNLTTIKTDDDLIRFQIYVPQSFQTLHFSCAYWSFDKGNGSWVLDNGCHFIGYSNNYAQCYCNHLTHFALLMITDSEETLGALSNTEELVLTSATYIGICLSIVGLVLTLITYIAFRFPYRNHAHVSLIMLCLSILFVNCFYIPLSLPLTNRLVMKRDLFCTILGFLFHYFFIASFMWMLIMAIVQYMRFVRIFNVHISYFHIKSCTIGWILPIIFPTLVVILSEHGGYTGEVRCWINRQSFLYLTFILPVSIVVICNFILFGFILKGIFQQNSITTTYKNSNSKLQIGATLCCFVSIGGTWLFAIVVLVEPSFNHQLIFSMCNSLQGFFIFFFHVFLSKPKRKLWKAFCMRCGYLKSSQRSFDHTDLITISYSASRNASRIIRPSKASLNVTSTLSTTDRPRFLSRNNSIQSNHQPCELLNVENLRLSNSANIPMNTNNTYYCTSTIETNSFI